MEFGTEPQRLGLNELGLKELRLGGDRGLGFRV